MKKLISLTAVLIGCLGEEQPQRTLQIDPDIEEKQNTLDALALKEIYGTCQIENLYRNAADLVKDNEDKAQQLNKGIRTDEDIAQQLQFVQKAVGALGGTMSATVDFYRASAGIEADKWISKHDNETRSLPPDPARKNIEKLGNALGVSMQCFSESERLRIDKTSEEAIAVLQDA